MLLRISSGLKYSLQIQYWVVGYLKGYWTGKSRDKNKMIKPSFENPQGEPWQTGHPKH